MEAEEYQISLPVFEGPFDLLLHLIRDNEIDIYDIPIARITDQYLAYLQRMEELDLEVASSFLVMAATLLQIKSRMLLPKPPPESEDEAEPEDPRAALVQDLLEYERFKEAAGAMSRIWQEQQRYFSRDNEIGMYASLFVAEHPLDGKTLADLQRAFGRVLRRAEERGELLLRVQREQVTLRDRLERMYALLREQPQGLSFQAAFVDCASRMEFIVTFLALLELVRQGVATVTQTAEYGDIYLYVGDLSKYVCE